VPELKKVGRCPTLWYETKGDRSKDPLVLLHGFTGTHSTWDQLGELLAERHYLILPDLPGHGKSGVSLSIPDMGVRATSEAVVELLRLESGNGKAALLGYSLGGRVALDIACNHQDLLSSLILEGASPGIQADDVREGRRAKDGALADDIERRGVEWFVDYWQETPLFATQKDLPRDVFEGIRRDRLSNSAQGLAMSLRGAGTGAMIPLWDKLGGIGIPVLLVVGKKDRKYTEVGGAMQESIPGSAVAQVDGAGHCVHIEKPKEFAALAERFLADRSTIIPAAEK
jgi:2-succinyl-6-hydroxy-2,4-cyclohexadiene-1-carboxylate synthase